MRAIAGRMAAVLLVIGLGACQLALPWQQDAAPPAGVTAQPGAIAGGAITVTPIKPGAPAGQAEPVAEPAPPEPQPEPEPAAPPKSADQIACENRGGAWSRAGSSIMRTCVFPTRDAGQSCKRQSDCEGLCLARSRSCAPLRPLFGCNDILQDDGRQVTLCID